MPYIKRDTDGNIIAVSQLADGEFQEEIDKNANELQQFLRSVATSQAQMQESDLDFVRVVEDLVELLIEKNYIMFTELPEKAQEKMRARQTLRGNMKASLDLLADEDDFYSP